jgi:phospholipid transport system substrate-binding protein
MRSSIMHLGKPLNRRSLAGMAAAMLVWGGKSYGQAAEARQTVADLYDALETAMHMGRGVPFQQRFDRLAPVIDRTFNLDAILQTSVGLRWASLDDAARRNLFTVFRAFTVASYTASFDNDGGEKFEILPQTRTSGADVIIETKLIATNGEPIRIDYVTRNSGAGGWRIMDVLLDGSISRVAVQRSDFRSLLASGDPNPLIDSLRRKVTDLSGGAIRLS